MSETDSKFDLPISVLGSCTAGLFGRLIFHPIDTAKSRIQSPVYSSYPGTLAMITRTARYEGIRGLYQGLGASIVGGLPATCIYLTLYEVLIIKIVVLVIHRY